MPSDAKTTPTTPKLGTDTVLTPPEQNTKRKITPALVIISTTDRSPAEAQAIVKLLGDKANQLVELYAEKNVARIRALVAEAYPKKKPDAKPDATTPKS